MQWRVARDVAAARTAVARREPVPDPSHSKPMNKDPLRHLLNDTAMMAELQSSRTVLESAGGGGAESAQLDVLISGDESMVTGGNYTQLEAIVLLEGRPALLIQDGGWEDPKVKLIRDRLAPAEAALKSAIPK